MSEFDTSEREEIQWTLQLLMEGDDLTGLTRLFYPYRNKWRRVGTSDVLWDDSTGRYEYHSVSYHEA